MTVRFEPLSRKELERIHAATVRVLEEHGVHVLEPEALALLKAAGASCEDSGLVRIPEGVLKECVGVAPRRFKLHGRGRGHVLAFGEGKTYLSTIGTAVQVESAAGEVRPASLKDIKDFYRLADALPYLDHSSWVVWPRDAPEAVGHLYEILYGFQYNTKSIDGYNWGRRASLDTLEMGAIVAGGEEELRKRPMLLGFCNPVSPLTLAKDTTEGLIAFARAGQPTTLPPECMSGGTAPATLAGVLVQQNAEVLASVCVAECAQKGAPVFYGSASTLMDMRTGAVALGAPEAGLLMAGTAQLARFYGIPSRGTGGNTDALASDYQAGAETASTLLLAALSGFDFIYDAAGSLESSLSAGYAKLVLDHDVCGEVRRILAGIDVSEDTLAVEVINAVREGGSFLSDPHTLRHFRQEHYSPVLFRRAARAPGKGAGKDLWTRAQERAETILREHVVDPALDPDVEKELLAYVRSAEKRYGVAAGAAA